MSNQLKEYTGTGASGGNSTDGNNIPSPRPFIDDEAELNNYLEKNKYGGEGNHYRKEPALPNPNRTRFTKFEENMNEDNVRPQVEDEVERFLLSILKKYQDKGYTTASIAQIVDMGLARIKRQNVDKLKEGDLDLGHEDNEPHMIKADLYRIGKYALGLYKMVDQFDGKGEVDFPSWWQAKITKSKDYLIGAKHYLDFELKKPQIDASMDEVTYNVTDKDDIPDNLNPEDKVNIQKENKMKKSDLLEDYMSSRKDTNLNEQMETYQKEAKRGLLMESAYKKFQELFDMGRTDEEAILDYASKGIQVPEQMVKRFREQYNKMKEMKLEYMKNEQEFKNQAKEIVNKPPKEAYSNEEKTLASGIYESKKNK